MTPETTTDFAVMYRDLPDEAVLQLAIDGGLRPEADAALKGEMQRRSLTAKDVRSLDVKQKRAQLQASVGNNPNLGRGTRLEFRGRKFLTLTDEHKGIAVATRWFVFAYMPLVPLGSYRVKEFAGGANQEIVGKVRLQWDQVLDGWKKAAVIILAFVGFMTAVIWWEHIHGR